MYIYIFIVYIFIVYIYIYIYCVYVYIYIFIYSIYIYYIVLSYLNFARFFHGQGGHVSCPALRFAVHLHLDAEPLGRRGTEASTVNWEGFAPKFWTKIHENSPNSMNICE